MDESRPIEDVVIVGGGDSGLLTALAIKKLNPGLDVSVVDDFDQEIPQVGKSTYSKILEILHEGLEIDDFRFVTEVRPIWKGSVYFRDWCGYDPFHYSFDLHQKFPSAHVPDAIERYYYFYHELADSDDHLTKGEEMVEQRKSAYSYGPRHGGHVRYDDVAYHLSTKRFNSFLRELCRERGISLINDEIVEVDVSDGWVETIRSKRQAYDADLYVDATGFTRLIKRHLESDFVEFPFELDTAYNTRIDIDLDDVVPATVIETGDHGWFWQIDTYDNRDLGYVFASEFVSDEDALEEFLAFCTDLGGSVTEEDVVKYTFISGYYEEAWEGNCIAIGNAEGFVEPLQSTGLTANAQAAMNLANMIASHGRVNDEAIREEYNKWVARSWESIADFISVHYKFADGDTEFWKAAQSIEVSDRVELLVDFFKKNGFDTKISPTRNTPGVDDLLVFRPINFFVVMQGMGVTSDFYEENDFEVSEEAKAIEEEYYEEVTEDVAEHYSNKEFYKGILEL